MNNTYKFSIVIAVYNAEKYIAETIESVMKQTLSFEQNIEIILVNDGSTDNSGAICKEFANRYKNNIKYHSKSNGGVSTARNLGIKYATGKYLNFLDSDDLLHPRALEVVYDFFEENKYLIDMVTLPIESFERESGLYARYTKFKNINHIVDLNENPQYYIFSCAASFYKRELFKEYRFNTNLKMAEDLYLNTKLFLKTPRFGMISPQEAVYYYRKRMEENSITSHNKYGTVWFTDVFDYLYKGIIRHVKQKKDKIPTFIKYILLYNVEQRITMPYFIDKKRLQNFYRIAESMLSYVDDEIIMNYATKDYFDKAILLMIKNKQYNIKECFKIDEKGNLMNKSNNLNNINDYSYKVSSIKFEDDNLILEGFINDIVPNDFKVFYVNNNEFCEINSTKTTNNFLQKRYFDIIVGQAYSLKTVIPFNKIGNTLINMCVNNNNVPIKIENAYNEEPLKFEQTIEHNENKYKIVIYESIISVLKEEVEVV